MAASKKGNYLIHIKSKELVYKAPAYPCLMMNMAVFTTYEYQGINNIAQTTWNPNGKE